MLLLFFSCCLELIYLSWIFIIVLTRRSNLVEFFFFCIYIFYNRNTVLFLCSANVKFHPRLSLEYITDDIYEVSYLGFKICVQKKKKRVCIFDNLTFWLVKFLGIRVCEKPHRGVKNRVKGDLKRDVNACPIF